MRMSDTDTDGTTRNNQQMTGWAAGMADKGTPWPVDPLRETGQFIPLVCRQPVKAGEAGKQLIQPITW